MQNPIQKFRQNSIVFEKQGILSENLKTLTSSKYPTVQHFLLILCTRFLLVNVYKRVPGKNQCQINHASYLNSETLKLDSQLPKKYVLFGSLKAL